MLYESYNRGWQGRFTIHKHLGSRSNIKELLSKLKRNRDFYYKIDPPPDFEKIDSVLKVLKIVDDKIDDEI